MDLENLIYYVECTRTKKSPAGISGYPRDCQGEVYREISSL
jgi:hypothetical protein